MDQTGGSIKRRLNAHRQHLERRHLPKHSERLQELKSDLPCYPLNLPRCTSGCSTAVAAGGRQGAARLLPRETVREESPPRRPLLSAEIMAAEPDDLGYTRASYDDVILGT